MLIDPDSYYDFTPRRLYVDTAHYAGNPISRQYRTAKAQYVSLVFRPLLLLLGLDPVAGWEIGSTC